MSVNKGKALIDELLAGPVAFFEHGRAYDLLQEYFAGLSLETLGRLLESRELYVQRAAVFIVAELGARATLLVDRVALLLGEPDRYVRYHVLEALAVCATGPKVRLYKHVVAALSEHDDVLRNLAMFLVSNAELAQIAAAAQELPPRLFPDRCSKVLGSAQASPSAIVEMLEDGDALVRRCGAIAARRNSAQHPFLLEILEHAEDEDVRRFSNRLVPRGK